MGDNRTVRIVIGCIAALCIAACAVSLLWPKQHHVKQHKAPVVKQKHQKANQPQKT